MGQFRRGFFLFSFFSFPCGHSSGRGGRVSQSDTTHPKANVVFAPIGQPVLAVLVLRPSRTILDACLFYSQSAAGDPKVSADL